MKKIFLIALLTFVFTGFVYATDVDFDRLDTDKSGTLSRQEFIDAATNKFKAYDANSDNVLTKEEFGKMAGKNSGGLFKKIDTDSNRKIDLKEFQEAAGKAFDRFDPGQRGSISKEEFNAKRAYPQLKVYF